MAKVEKFKSKSEMRRHEKMESPKKVAAEKKAGEKDTFKKFVKKGK